MLIVCAGGYVVDITVLTVELSIIFIVCAGGYVVDMFVFERVAWCLLVTGGCYTLACVVL